MYINIFIDWYKYKSIDMNIDGYKWIDIDIDGSSG